MITSTDFLNQLNLKATQHRVPINGSIELTHRCNLRCAHCYLGPQDIHLKRRKEELTTTQIFSILDQITEAGCLNLLITGGEPLLRKDFNEIYAYAKNCGLLITVFTNGTLIDESVNRLFADLPPRLVEISLYGASAETYEIITGNKNSFQRCLSGIESLIHNGINIKLKTVLMTLNRHEIDKIEMLARSFGVDFRFDAEISPTLVGDKAPLEYRIPIEDVVHQELRDESRHQKLHDLIERLDPLPEFDTLYQCGAGLTGFHINPYGRLQPCLMTSRYSYDLKEGDFETGWRDVIGKIQEIKAPPTFQCNHCEKRLFCGFCPALFDLENGSEELRSDYLCTLSHLRYSEFSLFGS